MTRARGNEGSVDPRRHPRGGFGHRIDGDCKRPDAPAAAPTTEEPRPWLAQPSSPAPVAGKAEGPSLVADWGHGAACGGLAGAAVYAKRRQRAAVGLPSAPSLTVVSSARVGAKAQLVLAAVEGRLLLVGVTESNVRKLAWIDAKPAEQKAETSKEFGDLIKGLLDDSLDSDEGQESAPSEPPVPSLPAVTRRTEPTISERSAALELALETRDEVETPASRPRVRSAGAAAERKERPRNLGVEGQARGLSRKRRGNRA